MLNDSENRKILTKWVLGIASACILLYLGLAHIDSLACAISGLLGLARPLLIGMVLALILNVPMRFFEDRLLAHCRMQGLKRPTAILLALILVIGIFVGIFVLVIPELVSAVSLLVQILMDFIDQIIEMQENGAPEELMWLEILLQADIIDWEGLLVQVEEWIRMEGGSFVSRAFGAAGSVVGSIATGFIGLIFSIYILSQKETLKRQACRLIRAWLPKTIGETIIHIAAVCSRIFRLFIAGQATEAVILGTLCMLGMMLLGLPYAPMIGALVGTTALIPIVGAFVGTIVGAVMIVTVNPVQALVFVAFLLILQQVEGNMIYPRVVGSKLNLPAIWVLAAITVGGNIAGPLGMLFGVPLVSSAYTLIREATEYREARQNRTEHKKT